MNNALNYDGSGPKVRVLAYLLSEYPAINHAFILREVRQLRALGFAIRCASIREPNRDNSRLTAEELEEKQNTFYIKTLPLSKVVSAHVRTLLSNGRGYLRGALLAVRMGRSGLRTTIISLLYFAEAVVTGDWMHRNGLEHVHTHYASNVAMIAERIFPITMSATFHGPDEFRDAKKFYLGEKIISAQFACAISHYGCSQLMKSCHYSQWNKLELIRLGVDTEDFRPGHFRDHPEPFELLCAGRMTPLKGLHVLLEAMELLKARCCPVRLHLAGDGEDRVALKERASDAGLGDSIVFHGFVNQDELRKLYAKTDLFVLPSFEEGIPVVLMEAMAMGIPCITTWVNGIPELIRNGIDGLTLAPGDSVALANAIAMCLGDRSLRKEFGINARVRAVEMADLSRNVQHLARIFTCYLEQQKVLQTEQRNSSSRFVRSYANKACLL